MGVEARIYQYNRLFTLFINPQFRNRSKNMSKITIPELKIFGYSSTNTVKAFLLLFGYEIGQLKQKYPLNYIDNLFGYKTSILDKIMHSICTYVMVVEDCQDYVGACLMVRNIIDSISAYHLIYHVSTDDEMQLRHYLYILDGAAQKLKILKKRPLRKTDKITTYEYNALSDQVLSMKNNMVHAQDVGVRKIKNLSIYNSHKKDIDALINNQNWKYIKIDEPNSKYSWSQIQAMFPTKYKKLYSDLCAYLSQFIHGLSASNFIYENADKDLYEPLSANVAIILNFIHESMVNDFDVDYLFLTEGFIESPNFPAYCSYLDND